MGVFESIVEYWNLIDRFSPKSGWGRDNYFLLVNTISGTAPLSNAYLLILVKAVWQVAAFYFMWLHLIYVAAWFPRVGRFQPLAYLGWKKAEFAFYNPLGFIPLVFSALFVMPVVGFFSIPIIMGSPLMRFVAQVVGEDQMLVIFDYLHWLMYGAWSWID